MNNNTILSEDCRNIKKEHIFHLKQKLPAELVRQAMTQVDKDWLKRVMGKKKKLNEKSEH